MVSKSPRPTMGLEELHTENLMNTHPCRSLNPRPMDGLDPNPQSLFQEFQCSESTHLMC